jgi:hypothetical protein
MPLTSQPGYKHPSVSKKTSYRKTSLRVTWYNIGLPNGTSLRADHWTFA